MSEPVTLDHAWSVGKALLAKCVEALFRVLALAFMVLLHWGLDQLAGWSFRGDFPKGVWVLRAVFFIAFCGVYAHESWEMVTIFVPSLKAMPSDPKLGSRR
jgi:hypothetical protein